MGASARPSSQDGVPQQQDAAPLSLPQLDRLYEASFARDESSPSNAGVATIPTQFKITQQAINEFEILIVTNSFWNPDSLTIIEEKFKLRFGQGCRTHK